MSPSLCRPRLPVRLPSVAPFLGDVSTVKLDGPVLGSVATPSGKGYYMVASDGGIFTFGDATFTGSLGDKPPTSPVVAVATLP